MDKQTYELLSAIKQRYLSAHGPAIFQETESGPGVSARQFYLKQLDDNLVRPMARKHQAEYARGSGSELDDKMKALRSSSAMTFNMLGNESCTLAEAHEALPSGTYHIAYEYQLPTLAHGLPANLDALLTRDDGAVIACEMKMLEWLTSTPMPLKAKYFDAASYRHPETAATFIAAARGLEATDVFVRYDYAQMFKHTLAVYNACRSGAWRSEAVTLLNCVWEPTGNYELSDGSQSWIARATAEEHAGFEAFREAMQPVCKLFADKLAIDFKITYVTTAALIEALAYPPQERDALQRYL